MNDLSLAPILIIAAGLAALLMVARAFRRTRPALTMRLEDVASMVRRAQSRMEGGETVSGSAAGELRTALRALDRVLPSPPEASQRDVRRSPGDKRVA